MLIQKIAEYFREIADHSQDYRSNLEQFILSKNPTSIEDVEYWTKQFDREKLKNDPFHTHVVL